MEQELLDNASKYSFVEAYKLLCECVIAQKLDPIHVVRIKPVLGLSHGRTQVVSVEKSNNADNSLLYFLNVNLPGLYGNDSPLPKFFTEELIQASQKEHNEARLFLDLIHQRLYQLFFAAKTQLLPHYLDNGKENLHKFMFSLVGFRNESWLRKFPDPNFILSNVNLFRHQKGTAAGLKILITKLFKQVEVEITQCVPRWFAIEQQQQLALSKQGHQLGVNALIGDKMQDIQSKLIIRISTLSAKEYKHWCINKENWQAFKQLIQYFINQPLLVDLQVEIKPEDKFNLTLEHGSDEGFSLGRNTWLLSEENMNKSEYITAPLALI